MTEAEMIAAHIASRGVTVCRPMLAEGAFLMGPPPGGLEMADHYAAARAALADHRGGKFEKKPRRISRPQSEPLARKNSDAAMAALARRIAAAKEYNADPTHETIGMIALRDNITVRKVREMLRQQNCVMPTPLVGGVAPDRELDRVLVAAVATGMSRTAAGRLYNVGRDRVENALRRAELTTPRRPG